MISQLLFNAVSRLIFSHSVRGYKEYHETCEDTYAAVLGPLYLELNRCFVLDHEDAVISIRIPTHWGTLHLGYVICLGTDEIRQPGFYGHWEKPLPTVTCSQACPLAHNKNFPF